MKTFAYLVVFVLAATTVMGKNEKALEEQVAPLCDSYPELNLCQLPSVLKNALSELQYLVEGAPETQKRKSAFVRFGKRKSAFVRFGRSDKADHEQEKRKSSYIRFG